MAGAARLTADSTVGEWLDHPVGGPIIRQVFEAAGQDVSVLDPARGFSLALLVDMSNGALPRELVDDLVRRADEASGIDPAEAAAADAAARADAEKKAPAWVETPIGGRFAGRTVIVTGAGSGIGRATASRVAREGGRVVAVDISSERLAELSASLPDAEIVTVTGDITDDASIAAIVAAAGERVDALANVAGIMDNMTPVHEVTDEVWARVFSINVDGTMKLMRAVIPGMLERGAGSIVNVASEASLRGSAAGVAYTASKHAVAGLTKSSAFMYGPSGIRVNAVAPGPTFTNIEARFDSELGAQRVRQAMAVLPMPVHADALAASITFLLSDDGVNVNGVILPSDGGWSAV